MAKKLALVNGIPRMVEEIGGPTIYEETLTVVASGAGANEINGPVTAGTNVTLPNSGTYSSAELEIWFAGDRLQPIYDYNYESSTEVSFTFQLEVDDILTFRIDRSL